MDMTATGVYFLRSDHVQSGVTHSALQVVTRSHQDSLHPRPLSLTLQSNEQMLSGTSTPTTGSDQAGQVSACHETRESTLQPFANIVSTSPYWTYRPYQQVNADPGLPS